MKNFVCGSLLLLCALALGGPAVADDRKIGSTTVGELWAMVNDIAAATGAVGAQVAVILGDERADFIYGSANTELGIPMTVDTVIQVGSITKVINAAMIMTLVEEGKLALDTPVIEYIPDFKLADQQAQTTITLRHLLSMSAGVDNGTYNEYGRGEDALARYVAAFSDTPQHFPPGTAFAYSNAGVCIAGYAAQRATGVSWDALVQKRIFEPAGLEHAVSLAEEFPYQRVSAGHTPAANGNPASVSRPWYTNRSQGPAGSTLAMSAHDLADFGRLFVNGGKAANGNRVLSETAVKAMMTPTVDTPLIVPRWGVGEKWGLGPSMLRWGKTVVWGHTGGNKSGVAQLIWIPEQRAVLAFLVNTPAVLDAFTARMFDEFTHELFGIRAPKLVVPEPPLRVDNPRRFRGTYERYQARYEISEQAGQLHYKWIQLDPGVPAKVMMEGTMLPLGGDNFLLKTPASADGIPLAFFGDDGPGRATNMLNPMRPSRRAD